MQVCLTRHQRSLHQSPSESPAAWVSKLKGLSTAGSRSPCLDCAELAFLGGGVIKMFQIWLSWWWHNFPYTLKLIELYAYNWYIFFMYELYLNKLLTGKNQVTTCHHLCPTFLLNKELSYMVHGFLPFPFIFNSTVLWLLMNINIVTHTVFLIAKDF